MKKIVPKVPFQGNRFAARQPEQTVDGNGTTEECGNEVLRTGCGGCTLQGEEPAYL